jgi:hypothetical protein
MLLFLTGCVFDHRGYERRVDELTDLDEDGFPASEDCNDRDPATFPGAADACDGRDNDCDGDVDDVPTETWYRSEDGDLWGAPTSAELFCSRPDDGWVLNGDDCDDTNGNINPLGTEQCDGLDNNCDGRVDEEGAASLPAAYPDADGDGFGSDALEVHTCTVPDGYVLVGGDCDDGNEEAHPGLTEVCGDASDNDCDGTDNGCTPYGERAIAEAAVVLYGTGVEQSVGIGMANHDVTGDGRTDLVAFSYPPGDDGGNTIDVWFGGTLQLGEWDVASAPLTFDGYPESYLNGNMVSADVDGDGRLDHFLGLVAPYGEMLTGAVAYVDGTRTGLVQVTQADHWAVGNPEELLSSSLALINGSPSEGETGLLVGAGWMNAAAPKGGALLLYDLGPEPVLRATIAGALEDGNIGEVDEVVLVSDLDGDGVDDVAVGSSNSRYNDAVHVFFGPLDTDRTTADADINAGADDDLNVGYGVTGGFDLTNDGYLDLVTTTGTNALVYTGPGLDDGTGSAWFTNYEATGEASGVINASVGDLNGDGMPDLAIGACNSYDYDGVVVVEYGPIQYGQYDLLGTFDRMIVGSDGMGAGWLVAIESDLGEDGLDDLVIGAAWDPYGGVFEAGSIYVFPGEGL